MCPIISDLKEQIRSERAANHSGKPSRRQRKTSAEKSLSKNAYRKRRRAASRNEKPTTAVNTAERGASRRRGKKPNAKPATPTVVVAATPTLGSYLPSVQVLCAISLVIGIIILIRSKQ